ncbi:glycosyltransferase family 2 protein [Nonomuraea rubra]|uniref:glycosyltransferase family 2 protein n=1 Tax=Nonomuraea rubra TaxID=46180 RepID=UPI003606D0A0
MADPRVGAVVITWNRREEVLTALGRLLALPERPQVVLVDNGSADGTAEAVARAYPEVDVVALDENLGAVGRNVGVERLRTPYVAFADDDTWWEPGSLARAADRLDAHPRLAVVTARILAEPGGRDDPIVAELRDSPCPAPAGCPARRWAASWRGRRCCGGRRSSNAAASRGGCGWAARRSCWPWTWRRPAGSCVTWRS